MAEQEKVNHYNRYLQLMESLEARNSFEMCMESLIWLKEDLAIKDDNVPFEVANSLSEMAQELINFCDCKMTEWSEIIEKFKTEEV